MQVGICYVPRTRCKHALAHANFLPSTVLMMVMIVVVVVVEVVMVTPIRNNMVMITLTI